MAMASRLLSRSKQLYAGGAILQRDHAVHVRSFAKEVAPLKGDEMLKNIFYDVKNKFETALGILRKQKITIDPDDPAAVTQYAKVMKTIREKADLFSESQRIKNTIQQRTQDIPDARTYLLTLQEIRAKSGLIDELGAEPMMLEALEKVEKEIKKPLLRSDKMNMSLLLAEFDKINKKLGIRKEDLPKYEEELELKIAKEQLKELKNDALEAMETQMKSSRKFPGQDDSISGYLFLRLCDGMVATNIAKLCLFRQDKDHQLEKAKVTSSSIFAPLEITLLEITTNWEKL